MNRFIFYLFLFAVICTSGVWCNKQRKLPFNVHGKIIGGSETTIQAHPYVAYLLLTADGSGYYQCGGSIISKNFVLTAAHCLTNAKKAYVKIGSKNSDGSGGTQYETTWFRIHPKFNGTRNIDYDAGLIKIEKGMNLDGTKAKAVALAKAGYEAPEGENITVTGWGGTSDGGRVSQILKVVYLAAHTRARCNELLGSITPRMMCAGPVDGGEGTCGGDSGGPAVVTSTNKLVGITSFGVNGCATRPSGFARASDLEIRSFITKYTGLK